jgi:hypothetical protein
MDTVYIAEVEKELAEVAVYLGEQDVAAYQARAKSAAQNLGSSSIGVLPRFYHYPNNPEKPEHCRNKFNGLGEWMELCQTAAFEIVYNFKQIALPYLRTVAFGSYDWPQGLAVAAMCRLATEGIESEEIVADLRSELPSMREETYYRAASLLLGHVRETPAIRVTLDSLEVPRFQEVLKELEQKQETQR